MSEIKYEIMGIEVICKNGIEYMPHGLFGFSQAIGFCTGRGHPDPLFDSPVASR